MTQKPSSVVEVYVKPLEIRKDLKVDGWIWEPLQQGGILRVKHAEGNTTKILK